MFMFLFSVGISSQINYLFIVYCNRIFFNLIGMLLKPLFAGAI